MFGFPTDLFGGGGGGNSRRNNALIPHHPGLFANSLMMPSPFGATGHLFGGLGIDTTPFAMMDRMMRGGAGPESLFLGTGADGNGSVQSFTSTTVMSYSGTDGRPKVYQESTSHRRGPGGIEETRQAVRDSERGINKMQVGHRIGDRKHVIEREMNAETGQISENVELENLNEDETDDFKKEWRRRSAHGGLLPHPHHHYRHQQQQLGSNRHYHQSSSSGSQPQLAIEQGSSNRQHHKSSRKNNDNIPIQRHQFQHSDTIDLTEDTPDDEVIEQLPPPLPAKRKASSSSSNDVDSQRKHRQHRV